MNGRIFWATGTCDNRYRLRPSITYESRNARVLIHCGKATRPTADPQDGCGVCGQVTVGNRLSVRGTTE